MVLKPTSSCLLLLPKWPPILTLQNSQKTKKRHFQILMQLPVSPLETLPGIAPVKWSMS